MSDVQQHQKLSLTTSPSLPAEAAQHQRAHLRCVRDQLWRGQLAHAHHAGYFKTYHVVSAPPVVNVKVIAIVGCTGQGVTTETECTGSRGPPKLGAGTPMRACTDRMCHVTMRLRVCGRGLSAVPGR